LTQAYKDLGVEESMLELGNLTPAMLVKLGENQIKTQDDFAELAVDEVKEMLSGFNIPDETIGAIIMKARAKWFEDPAS
jgi:N utilization substance protein A